MLRLYCVITHFETEECVVADLPHGIDKDLILISQHDMCVTVDGKQMVIPPDTCLYYPANTPIYYSSYGDCFCNSQIQFYNENNFTLQEMLPAATPIHLDDPTHIHALINIIAYENMTVTPEHDRIIDFLMNSLILKLKEAAHIKNNTPYSGQLIKLRQNIYQYPEIKRSLADISKSLNISPAYFQKLYKQLFATTCNQDIINSRILAAKNLLLYTNQSVEDIAFNVGYSSAEHFSRQFKKHVDITPVEYRKKANDSEIN